MRNTYKCLIFHVIEKNIGLWRIYYICVLLQCNPIRHFSLMFACRRSIPLHPIFISFPFVGRCHLVGFEGTMMLLPFCGISAHSVSVQSIPSRLRHFVETAPLTPMTVPCATVNVETEAENSAKYQLSRPNPGFIFVRTIMVRNG